jgi:hypothetical protein
MIVDEGGSWKLRLEAEENGSLLRCKKLGGRCELLRARSDDNASGQTVSGLQYCWLYLWCVCLHSCIRRRAL